MMYLTYYFIEITMFLAMLCTMFIVSAKNPMVSILYMMALFVMASTYLYLMGLGIFSLLYIMIYMGAIAVTFLFMMTLLDMNSTELSVKSNMRDLPLVLMSLMVLTMSGLMMYSNENILINKMLEAFGNDYNTIMTQNWFNMENSTLLTTLGNVLLTNNAFMLLVLAMVLLLGMMGPISMTMKHKE
uniref:NADH-ubiquinone oxidoreductase chain 6 n=1 Tax=Yarrowia phangngaensis TaxID=444778 RepID=G4U4V6_9ASCO|nr:NADH dehydrogenase subunit 6 [Yarrowia phangngaensis]CCC29008.1 subunit ND6 of proton translocating NADH:ubiquinone oxidoreductase [Yarrowia phangngaensis]